MRIDSAESNAVNFIQVIGSVLIVASVVIAGIKILDFIEMKYQSEKAAREFILKNM